MPYNDPMKKSSLIIGDILSLLITTLLGFLTHHESPVTVLTRFLAAFIPLTAVWFLLAPWLRLFQAEITSSSKQLWRVPVAMLFVSPLAVTVRGFLLASDVKPIFVLVFGITSVLGLTLWRGLYIFLKPKVG